MVLLAVYSFEILGPKVKNIATQGPSPALQKLQKKQASLGGLAFLAAIVVLVLSSFMRYI